MYTPHPHSTFKTDEVKSRYQFMSPTLQEICYDMCEWAEDKKIPFELTETVSTPAQDEALKRVSATHRTGRAFDLSLHGWSENQIQDFMKTFEVQFSHYAALGGKSGKPALIVRHNVGFGDHIHVQIAVAYAINDPLKLQTQA